MSSVCRFRVFAFPVVVFLVSWVGSIFLMVSPTVAQVLNGPGPSPSGLFDLVFNLPGDESVAPVYDFPSATIGGGGATLGGPYFLGTTTQINVSDGGIVGDFTFLDFDTEANITGGTVGNNLTAFGGVELNISGGNFGDSFFALFSAVEISGGTFGNNFEVLSGSVNIIGSQFSIDGTQLDGLLLGEPFEITDRDVVFSALLDDGELFSIDLNSVQTETGDFFSPDATLTVTFAVPEPSSSLVIALAATVGLVRRRRK